MANDGFIKPLEAGKCLEGVDDKLLQVSAAISQVNFRLQVELLKAQAF
jgi:hypothetical protein